ncbi:hypothetical protein, partial [Bradyrhizobium diazoefficiens]|uniref:hypothetical protein n=2 Tax=Bradyrhizobium diazoefficiens TaxID=1355477 RepID=UPI002543C0D1
LLAANHCRIEALGLMPWQSLRCYPTLSALDQPYGDPGAKREGAELALRMRGLLRHTPYRDANDLSRSSE